jgi:hypothetical protein
MTSHFDEQRRAEFYGGPWDGQSIQPTHGVTFPAWIEPTWEGQTYVYRAQMREDGTVWYQYRGQVMSNGGRIA